MIDASPEYALCSLSKIRERVAVAKETDEFDEGLCDFARLATQIIESDLGISFKQKAYVEYKPTSKNYRYESALYSPSMTSGSIERVDPVRILLKGYPLADDATVDLRYDPFDRAFGSDTVIDAVNYVLEPETGRLVLEYPVDSAERSLKISYTAGFVLDYDTPAEGSARQDELSEDADVSSSMTHAAADAVAVLFDGEADKGKAASGAKVSDSAYVQWDFSTARAIAEVAWYAPNDATPGQASSTDISEVTLTLQGVVGGDWDNEEVTDIASRNYTGVQAGDKLTLSAETHATLYKSFRMVVSVNGATTIYCAQATALFKDTQRGYLLSVPSRLAMACALLTKYLWGKDRTGGVGFRTAVERKGASFATDGLMPPEVVELLQPYRRLRVA